MCRELAGFLVSVVRTQQPRERRGAQRNPASVPWILAVSAALGRFRAAVWTGDSSGLN
jgi:hypothetical protein